LIGRVHGVERGERGVWGNGSATGGPDPRDRERECAGKKTGADRLAPLGSERWREGAREGGPPVRRRGRAAWLGRLGWFGLLSPFLFL
jgi:hypothetical protein